VSDGLPISMPEVLDASARTLQARIHTHLPGKVVSYDPVTNTANVQPMVKGALFDREGERSFEELPTIPSVPVLWPRAGGFVVRLPLEAGDGVLLCFSEASLAEWRTTGQLSEPTDARRHSLGHAFAIPGAFPDVDVLSPLDAVEILAGGAIIGTDGSATDQIIIGGTVPGVRIGKLAVSPVALATPLLAYVSAAAAAATAIQAALAAIVAIPANAAALPNVTASGTAVTAAATAATAAASTAASTVTKSL
jgi:hypothetical protein